MLGALLAFGVMLGACAVTDVPGPGDGQDMPGPAVPAPIRDADYQLAFEDDFEGSELDTSVWNTGPVGGSLPATVAGGRLTIKTTAANNHHWGHLASTGPRSDGEPSYANPKAWQEGYVEARTRYTDNPWSWPAFWMFSMAKSEAWPGEDCSLLNAEWGHHGERCRERPGATAGPHLVLHQPAPQHHRQHA
jgi:hypothetical protein